MTPFPSLGEQANIGADSSVHENVEQGLLWHLLYFYGGPYAMLYAYWDESDPQHASAFCVAGVLYTCESVQNLDREWEKELTQAGIRRFHTVEYVHKRGEFDGMNPAVADALYIRLLEILKRNASGSVVVYSIPIGEFDVFREEKWRKYSPYTTCGYICVGLLSGFAEILNDVQVDFAIEAGQRNMGEFNALITQQRERGGLPKVASHSFASKEIRPLQSADILAYEYGKRIKDMMKGSDRDLRKSLKSIIGDDPRHVATVLNAKLMEKFYASLR
jgi:hypothetical protein